MPVYIEDELDAINKAGDDDFRKKLAVWKNTSKKKRTKNEPRRGTAVVQEYACLAFQQNCLLRKDGKGCIVCEDNGGGMGVLEDRCSGNLVSRVCACKLCQSNCMIEYKEGEEQRMRLAARWAEEEDESDVDGEDEQGREFAKSVMGFAESSRLFLEQNNDEVNISNVLSVMSHDMAHFEMEPNQRYLLRKAVGPQSLRVRGRHIRTLDRPPRSNNREKNNRLVSLLQSSFIYNKFN